jgi:hypothetical protein
MIAVVVLMMSVSVCRLFVPGNKTVNLRSIKESLGGGQPAPKKFRSEN